MSKSKFRKIAVAALSAIGITSLAFGVSGCMPKSTDVAAPDNIEISRSAPPEDGSLPTAHTCAENLSYIIYKFDHQPQYHTYSYGVTSASIATQTTRNFRDYKDGILMNTDLTYSSMVKGGTQTCSMYNADGGYDVYFRTSEAPEADTMPSEAVWNEDKPLFFDEKAYNFTYGLLPNELFNYIVNEDNIIDSEQIKVNADDTYTLNFTLDPVASTYYYQFGMKTRGGLSGFPDFESITFSVTFDGEWQILSAKMHEVSKINKGIVVSSVSDFNTQYWYGDDHFDEEHFSYYENYFKQYIGQEDLEQGGSKDEGLVIDVTNVLSNGFSQIMNGGAQFEISAQLGANKYVGYVFLSLDLANPLETLALKASLGKTLKEQTLYLEYGNDGLAAYYGEDFAVNANLTEVKLAVGEFEEIINKIKAAFTVPEEVAPDESAPAEGTEQTAAQTESDPLTELMNSMVLVAGEKQAVLTLDTDDLLGLGIGINANLVFGINDNKISFRNASVGGLSIGGEDIDLSLNLATTTAPEIHREPSETGADLAEYIGDIRSLLGADLLKVNVNLNGDGEKVSIGALKGLGANVTAYADIDGVTVGAEADVFYTYKGQKVSAKASIWYGYSAADRNYGKAIVSLTEFNDAPVDFKIKCDIKEVAEAISTLVTFGGGDGGEASKGLAGILNGALSSDFSTLLTEMYADKAQIKVGLNVDALLGMLSVKTGVKFGSCTLKYARGAEDAVYGGELSASLPALGLDLSVCGESGSVAMPDDSDCLDLKYLIDDIKDIATSELLKAHVSLNGGAEGVTVKELNGLTAEIDAYLNLDGLAVAADVTVGYEYGVNKVTASLSAWYEKGESGLGKIILSLNEINGVSLSAKVYCDITEIKEAVTALLEYGNIQLAPFDGGQEEGKPADIIAQILAADFGKLLPAFKADADGINIALNVDELLTILNVNANISLGNVSLVYDHSADKKLVAAAPALGLTADISGAAGGIGQMPATADCLDLTKLVNTVKAAWEQVNGIIDGESVAFEIAEGETFLSIDGIVVNIWGKGEVSWKAGGEYVALDLSMLISEYGNTDVTTFKFIYDKNAAETPLVKLALNNVGIEIYKDDIDGVRAGFEDIYNKVMSLLGGNGGETQPTEPAEAATTTDTADGAETGEATKKPVITDKLLGVIFGILSDDNWVGILNDLTLTSDGKSVALTYLSDNSASIEIGADGNLSLFYDAAFGKRFTMSGGIIATAADGGLLGVLDGKFETCKMSSSKEEGSAGFVKLAYDYLFEAISSIDVSHILGSDTYTVKFKLNGANTNIAELSDVYANAEVYITGASGDQPKLAEGDLDINVKGVAITLNVITERRNGNTQFFINLSQVMDIKLPDLKFKATQQSLYETFDAIFKALNDTNILEFAGKLMGGGKDNNSSEMPAQNGGGTPVISDETADKLADFVTKLINFNFNSAVVATETNGVTTAQIDLDNIVKQLGVETGALGTVEAVINHNNHSMKSSGKTLITDLNGNTELKEWISLSSEKAVRRDYSKLDRGEYISIEFLPDLIDDLLKVATNDNGDIYTSYTLSGNIKANLVGLIDVNIDPCTVTAKIGEDGLSASIVMHINKAKVIGIGIPESTVGLTYKNGLLTLAKGLNTSMPEYKVMTFDYFIDNMMSGDELLNWLLEISGWGIFKGFLPEINSGLTTTQDVKLYEASKVKEEQEISMYTFVNALRVVIDGLATAEFGDYAALESDLGVHDNYYGFALNAGVITNGVLTKLNAAITRTDAGLDRILASGAIQSYVTFSANLGFKQNWSAEYETGNALADGATAPDLYDKAMNAATSAGYTPDFDFFEQNPQSGYDKKFGCMSVSVSGGEYSASTQYSNVLYSHTLTIVRVDGETEERFVRHGSTVYLYDNSYPVFTDETRTVRVLYSTSPDSVGGTSVVMNGDMTVYEVRRAAVNVVVHNGSEEVVVSSFVDDKVPTRVAGLETIVKPVYADGTQVGDNDVIDGSSPVIHIYGTFVKTETVVNFVKYTFSADTMSYTASGKAAGFNDYYSVKGNTLVLENEIGGYPVTAIAANAFANTDGKAIKSVIVPENVVTVGKNAFLDNVGMESAVFLAERVEMLGTGGKDNNDAKDQPFYGCTAEAGGTSSNLKIYYNEIVFGGSTTDTIWTKVRVQEASLGIKYRYYIGGKPSNENGYARDGGGALYGKGSWTYVDYAVNVDINGVTDGTLSEEAVKNILAPYFPYASTAAYAGSSVEASVNNAMNNAITRFTVIRGGITYTCVYTAEISEAGGRTTVTFNVKYTASAQITVVSPYATTVYGTAIAANESKQMTVPVVDGEIVMPALAEIATHTFKDWTVTEENGNKVYTANWQAKEFTLTVKLYRGGTDTNYLHYVMNGGSESSEKISGGGIAGSTTVKEIKIYGGEATFSVSGSVLTIENNGNTHTVWVTEGVLKWFNWQDSGNKRGINSDVNGSMTVTADMTLTLSY